jgi:hypothetical protein
MYASSTYTYIRTKDFKKKYILDIDKKEIKANHMASNTFGTNLFVMAYQVSKIT